MSDTILYIDLCVEVLFAYLQFDRNVLLIWYFSTNSLESSHRIYFLLSTFVTELLNTSTASVDIVATNLKNFETIVV